MQAIRRLPQEGAYASIRASVRCAKELQAPSLAVVPHYQAQATNDEVLHAARFHCRIMQLRLIGGSAPAPAPGALPAAAGAAGPVLPRS